MPFLLALGQSQGVGDGEPHRVGRAEVNVRSQRVRPDASDLRDEPGAAVVVNDSPERRQRDVNWRAGSTRRVTVP